MKRLLLLTLPLLLSASDAELMKEIQFLKDRILKLEQLVKKDSTQTIKKEPDIEITKLQEQITENKLDLEEVMPILEVVERKSILDKINFSPEIDLRVDKMDYDIGAIAGENTKIYNNSDASLNGLQRRDEYSKSFKPAGFIRVRLNMDAQLDKDVKFNGRMIFTQSSQTDERLCILSRDIKSSSANSAFTLDRAYFDYRANKNFTFSFGLLPTTGGTPMNFAQNTQRKSMFPALVFDMNTYGVIGTQKLGDNTYARAIIAKGYTLRPDCYSYQCNRENIDNANVFGLYFDTKIDAIGDSLVSFGVNMLNDFKAHPFLGPDIDSDYAKNLGDMYTLGLGIDSKNIADSGLTLFAHTAMSIPDGNGKKDDYQIVAISGVQDLEDGLTASGQSGFSEADYAQGAMLSDNGYSFYLGAKYSILPTLDFGTEYNYGSKYWFSATQGAEDIYNKLATRGHVGEAYILWQFHKYLNAKIGYMYTNENYTGSGWHFGEPVEKDGTQKISYINISAKY